MRRVIRIRGGMWRKGSAWVRSWGLGYAHGYSTSLDASFLLLLESLSDLDFPLLLGFSS